MNRKSKCQCGTLEVYSASSFSKQNINKGNRILLPTSTLQQINGNYLGIMTFKLQSVLDVKKSIYVGVLEFTAEEVPDWIFDAMGFYDGLSIPITAESIQRIGSLIKVQPHKTAFIKLPNPKDILRTYLKNFTCLTQDETISINFQDVNYLIDIIQVEPINHLNAICIDEFDFDIDIMDPLDLNDPPENLFYNSSSDTQQEELIAKQQQIAFSGKGIRIDGKFSITYLSQPPKYDIPKAQYDPRKQKLVNGLKQKPIYFIGASVKLGSGKTKYNNSLDNYFSKLTIL